MKTPIHPPPSFVEFSKDEIEQSIPARFEQQVQQYPTRLAVKTRQRAFTYEGLNRAANRIARAVLARCGSGAQPVGLLLEPDAMSVAAVLGVLKASRWRC
jgi:non-ribosomal peptide synthetase component F